MRLYDIGCFNGDSPLQFIADPEIDEIYAYDPNPRYTKIWRAIESHYPNIHFAQAAVSDKDGKVPYNMMPERIPLGSSITHNKHDFDYGEKIMVKCVDIAKIVDRDCWIKLDAEGEEFRILERLIDTGNIKHVKKIYLEWHTSKLRGYGYDSRQRAIEQKLQDLGIVVRSW